MSLAKDYIELTELWENTDKAFVIDNIERLIGYPVRGHKNAMRINTLAKVANATNHTVVAWLNRSRTNVKIPLIKLCMLADYFNVDIRAILSQKLACNRDWDSFVTIDNRQKQMFKRVNESDYFNNGSWDLQGLIGYIDSIEDYGATFDKPMQLVEDCKAYLSCVTGIKAGVFMEDVQEQVIKFLKENK